MRLASFGLLALPVAFCAFAACGGDDDGAVAPPGVDGGTSTGSSGSASGEPPVDAGDDDPAIAKLPPSCRAVGGKGPGIDTCGAGEDAKDGCCTSLTLPKTQTRTLDKYEITAGRMRSFVDAVPDMRRFAKDFAAANPASQLGTVAKDFPATGSFGSYLDVLPDHYGGSPLDGTVFLGAFPVDALNDSDGCFIAPNGYGAATFWQPPERLKGYGIGLTKGADNKPDGTRKYGREVLDTKALNCVSAIVLATFCAWDGGELARTSDFHEVWGRQQVKLPGANGATVFVPWEEVLPWGDFNWRNGHNGACPAGWLECVARPAPFYLFPAANAAPKDDDSVAIIAPGRMPKDVTKAVSPDGGGWFDIGGNLMDQAWPNTKLVPAAEDFCDTSAGGGAGALKCDRDQGASDRRPGTLRFKGKTPGTVLVGYSFEVHARRAEKYLSAAEDDEANLVAGDIKPAHFQYGKIGGRCARVK